MQTNISIYNIVCAYCSNWGGSYCYIDSGTGGNARINVAAANGTLNKDTRVRITVLYRTT